MNSTDSSIRHQATRSVVQNIIAREHDEINKLLLRQLALTRAELDFRWTEVDDVDIPGFHLSTTDDDHMTYDGWCHLIAWRERAGVKGTHIAQIVGRARYGPGMTDDQLRRLAGTIDTVIGLNSDVINDRQALDIALMTRVPLMVFNVDALGLYNSAWNRELELAQLVHRPASVRLVVHNGCYFQIDETDHNPVIDGNLEDHRGQLEVPRITEIRSLDTNVDRIRPTLPTAVGRSRSGSLRRDWAAPWPTNVDEDEDDESDAVSDAISDTESDDAFNAAVDSLGRSGSWSMSSAFGGNNSITLDRTRDRSPVRSPVRSGSVSSAFREINSAILNRTPDRSPVRSLTRSPVRIGDLFNDDEQHITERNNRLLADLEQRAENIMTELRRNSENRVTELRTAGRSETAGVVPMPTSQSNVGLAWTSTELRRNSENEVTDLRRRTGRSLDDPSHAETTNAQASQPETQTFASFGLGRRGRVLRSGEIGRTRLCQEIGLDISPSRRPE